MLAFLCTSLGIAQEAEEEKPPRTIAAALEDGIAALLSLQQADGTWLGPQSIHYDGMTPLAVYTLVKCGLAPDHPAVLLGRKAMSRFDPERTYDPFVRTVWLDPTGEQLSGASVVAPWGDRLLIGQVFEPRILVCHDG